MQDTLLTIAALILKGVVLPVVGIAVAWASTHLPAWLQAHVKNARVEGIMERLSTLAFHVVSEVEQTVISTLGETPSPDQLKAARDQALATLKSHLGDQGLKEIETVFGLENQDAVIRLLITVIESTVNALHKTP